MSLFFVYFSRDHIIRLYWEGNLKPIFLIVSSLLLLLSYNNCAQQKADEPHSSQKMLESYSNGTPYGGKLIPGSYVPTQNQICNENSQELIKVEGTGNKQAIYHEVPCENKRILLQDDDVLSTQEKDRFLYNSIGFAHETTSRAMQKEHYKVACRTTEANYGAEILVYGLGPLYSFENLSSDFHTVLYSVTMEFHFQYNLPSQHAFVGEYDKLYLTETEGRNRFIGSWESTQKDTSKWSGMICEQLDKASPHEWN